MLSLLCWLAIFALNFDVILGAEINVAQLMDAQKRYKTENEELFSGIAQTYHVLGKQKTLHKAAKIIKYGAYKIEKLNDKHAVEMRYFAKLLKHQNEANSKGDLKIPTKLYNQIEVALSGVGEAYQEFGRSVKHYGQIVHSGKHLFEPNSEGILSLPPSFGSAFLSNEKDMQKNLALLNKYYTDLAKYSKQIAKQIDPPGSSSSSSSSASDASNPKAHYFIEENKIFNENAIFYGNVAKYMAEIVADYQKMGKPGSDGMVTINAKDLSALYNKAQGGFSTMFKEMATYWKGIKIN